MIIGYCYLQQQQKKRRENFERQLSKLLPEMLFFVGSVRTPDGIEGNEKITTKVLNTMHALRRLINFDTLKPSDTTLIIFKGSSRFKMYTRTHI
jgi:hypothetical protein